MYKRSIISIYCYLHNSHETYLKEVIRWSNYRGQKSLKTKATSYCNEINEDINIILTLPKETMKQRIKNSFLAHNKNKYERYPLHGQYSREINQPYIDKSDSLAWMKNAKLKPETESTICAIQEQSVTTKYIEKRIHKSTDNDICRLCNTFPETIHHIIAGCPALAQLTKCTTLAAILGRKIKI